VTRMSPCFYRRFYVTGPGAFTGPALLPAWCFFRGQLDMKRVINSKALPFHFKLATERTARFVQFEGGSKYRTSQTNCLNGFL
jgi:hypothetical protein